MKLDPRDLSTSRQLATPLLTSRMTLMMTVDQSIQENRPSWFMGLTVSTLKTLTEMNSTRDRPQSQKQPWNISSARWRKKIKATSVKV